MRRSPLGNCGGGSRGKIMSNQREPNVGMFSALIVVLIALVGPSSAQESYTDKVLTKNLEKEKKAYAAVEVHAKHAFAQYFDRASALVRKDPGLAPELKASKLRTIA